jgi:enediyne biosynthesis protein E4
MPFVRMMILFSVITGFISCKSSSSKLFSLLAANETNIHFANTVTETPQFNVLSFEYIYNGAGVAAGDVNNDGLTDLFFAGNQVSSKLYLNKGNFKFEDVTETSGTLTKYWCTGVSMVDINADGLMDISVATINPIDNQSSPNLFFINTGTDKNGVPHFLEVAAAMGIADTGYSTQTAFLDYDRDGDLDMYLLNNANVDYNRNEIRQIMNDGTSPANDKLYRNDGIDSASKLPHFTDVSKQAGITQEGWGLGVVVTDINKDGWPDIAVANDFISSDLLLINNRNGGFVNKLKNQMRHTSQNSMGIDAADINNDGFTDIATVDMKPFTNQRDKSLLNKQPYDKFYLGIQNGYEPQFIRNMLQVNNGFIPSALDADRGEVSFSEVGQMAGMYATDWSWSILFADYDNNGNKDIYITNGYRKDVTDLDYLSYVTDASNFVFGNDSTRNEERFKKIQQLEDIKIPNFMYSNSGTLQFKDVSDEWGLMPASFTNGAVYADLDNDGDLDIVTNNLNDKAFIYKNNSDAAVNHFLTVKCKSSSQNVAGIGVKATLFYGDKIQYEELYPTRGYKSCMEPQLHFGLGSTSTIDSVQVVWPSGKMQTLTNVKASQVITVEEKNATAIFLPASNSSQTYFTQTSSLQFTHHENDFIDFKLQPLLPYQYSSAGPCSAVGDVNGDGLDDLFTGGSLGDTSYVFIQHKNGNFTKKIFESGKHQDDAGALIFDADNDGDNDIIVAAGGNESPLNHSNYSHRFYKNDGAGNFTADSTALPANMYSSAGSIIAADYDKDGDLDVLITGRVSPKNYPLPGKTYLLQNNKGKFTDVTDKLCPGLRNAGMVNTALFTDYDNDGHIDLAVAGEWMPVTLYHNEKGKFVNQTAGSGIGSYTGMWNSLVSGDFDNDGDIDFIAGNMGLNNRFSGPMNEPVNVYAKDFNEDGRIDPILTYFVNHKEVTVAYRDELIEQIINMRRRFQRYADLGKASIADVISSKELKGAYKASCNYTASAFIKNNGKGKFEITALPLAAQTAPVYGMLTGYFDGDDNLDVLMIGNNYSTNIVHGWQDAFNGLLLTGDGTGNFNPVALSQSGFYNAMDGKSLSMIMQHNKALIAAFNNNSAAKCFSVNNTAVKYINLQAADEQAVITLQSGKNVKADLPYGSGYLSQSSRVLAVPSTAQKIVISSYKKTEVKTLGN